MQTYSADTIEKSEDTIEIMPQLFKTKLKIKEMQTYSTDSIEKSAYSIEIIGQLVKKIIIK